MFLKSQLTWNVVVPAKNLDRDGSMVTRAIVLSILNQFTDKKTSKDLGYFLAVTTLDDIGEGKISHLTGDTIFSVTFSCITFKMVPGEVLTGTVHKTSHLGVFLRCGPADKIYLSSTKMPGYHYVPGDKQLFVNKSSKIEKGTVLKFVVLDVSYIEAENDTQAIARIDEDYLGVLNHTLPNGYSSHDDSSEDSD